MARYTDLVFKGLSEIDLRRNLVALVKRSIKETGWLLRWVSPPLLGFKLNIVDLLPQ